jgi:hypothetical protein
MGPDMYDSDGRSPEPGDDLRDPPPDFDEDALGGPVPAPPAPVPPPAAVPVAQVRNKRVICTYTDYTSQYKLYEIYRIYIHIQNIPAYTEYTDKYRLYQHIQIIQSNTYYTSIYRLYKRIQTIHACTDYTSKYRLYVQISSAPTFFPHSTPQAAAGWVPGAQFDSSVDAPERMRDRLPRFSREETEIMSSYTRSRGGEPHGDRLLEWVTSPEFRAQQVRYRRMRTFSRAAVKEYVPEGVQRVDFTEPLDGCQRLIFFFRSLYDAIKELLKNSRFSGRQYTQAEVKFHPNGLRAYNTINSGKVFEAAQITAGPGVSPVLVLLSSDSTLVSKHMGGHPILGAS